MMVGRSKAVTGPYLDQAGISMEQGGGTLVLQGNADWFGVGHNAVATFDKVDYLVFHGYDGHDQGRPKLRIEPIVWNAAGWPTVATK
jgi:arabinan endo-1,5-alpha-L-arabinosidase